MRSTAQKSTARLGTQFRGKLAAAYNLRGHQSGNLYFVYSPRTNRDWVLCGDLAWAHFLLVEGDPNVLVADYAPQVHVIETDSSENRTEIHAQVTLFDGHVEYRVFAYARAASKRSTEWERAVRLAALQGYQYVRYTEEEIFAKPHRLANWKRAIAWISAARGHLLLSMQNEISSMLAAQQVASLQQIISMGHATLGPCYLAAIFRGIQERIYWSDLDHSPINKNTLIGLAGGSHA